MLARSSSWLLLAALLAFGCASPADGDDAAEGEGEVMDDDALEDGPGAEAAEQAIRVDGCTFDSQRGGIPLVGAVGYATYSCKTTRTITINVCLDEWTGTGWRAYSCTGNLQRTASPEVQETPHTAGTKAHNDYRIRTRVEGYGKDILRFALPLPPP